MRCGIVICATHHCSCYALFGWVAHTARAQPASDRPVIRCVAFSPDGRYFAACGSRHAKDGQLAIWETESWRLTHQQRDTIGYPQLAFSPDSKSLVLSRFAPETHLIDIASGKTTRQFKGRAAHARCVTFTPDGSRVITGNDDRSARIWDVQTGALLETITGDFGNVYDVDVSPDGRLLAIADGEQYLLRLFDLDTLKQVFVTKRMGSLVPQVCFSPDGQRVAASSWGGYSRLYDVATKELRYEFDTNSARSTCFPADGQRIAVAASLKLYVFSFPTADSQLAKRIRQLIREFEQDDYQVREQASRELAALGGVTDPFLRAAIESQNPEVRWRARRLRKRLTSTDGARKLDMDRETECAIFSPNGKLLIGGDKNGNLIAWNVGDWTVAGRWTLPDSP
ncbi:MAG: WD40 repeat domain-containing protein [Pirellulaceae bacterium]